MTSIFAQRNQLAATGRMSLKVLLAAIVCLQVLRLAESHYDKEKFKPIVYTDHSNDDAIELNAVS